MKCENIFCVYWYNNECDLREISLDIQGNCQECIYVNISESTLQKQRQNFLNNNKIKKSP